MLVLSREFWLTLSIISPYLTLPLVNLMTFILMYVPKSVKEENWVVLQLHQKYYHIISINMKGAKSNGIFVDFSTRWPDHESTLEDYCYSTLLPLFVDLRAFVVSFVFQSSPTEAQSDNELKATTQHNRWHQIAIIPDTIRVGV